LKDSTLTQEGGISCWKDAWLAEHFSKWGGHKSARQKNYKKFLWFELATVTSQAWKYDVITYTPDEGLNYTILDKI